MLALGIDPGTAICGYGFVESKGSRLIPRAYGSIFTTPNMKMEDRLLKIHTELDALIKKYQPDVMGVEKLFFNRNVTTAIMVVAGYSLCRLTTSHYRDLIEKYRIYPLVVGYDRNMARYLVQDMEAYGFQMDDVYQGENLTPVINEFEGLVRDNNLECGDNDLLKAHFYNAAVKENAESNRRKLVKLATAQHIDGMAALLDAMTVRQKWHDEVGHRLKNKG